MRLIHSDLSLETIDDAVVKLRERCPHFRTCGGATIKVGLLPLPDGGEVPLVLLVGPSPADRPGWSIGTASARGFKARVAGTSCQQFDSIEVLDGAKVDECANVTLSDGRHVFDVRLISAQATALTDAERLALLATVRAITGRRYVDYRELPDIEGLPLRALQKLIEDLRKVDSTIPDFSTEVLRSALTKAGIRRCRTMRRYQAKPRPAAI
jgi:hypothetical protein